MLLTLLLVGRLDLAQASLNSSFSYRLLKVLKPDWICIQYISNNHNYTGYNQYLTEPVQLLPVALLKLSFLPAQEVGRWIGYLKGVWPGGAGVPLSHSIGTPWVAFLQKIFSIFLSSTENIHFRSRLRDQFGCIKRCFYKQIFLRKKHDNRNLRVFLKKRREPITFTFDTCIRNFIKYDFLRFCI